MDNLSDLMRKHQHSLLTPEQKLLFAIFKKEIAVEAPDRCKGCGDAMAYYPARKIVRLSRRKIPEKTICTKCVRNNRKADHARLCAQYDLPVVCIRFLDKLFTDSIGGLLDHRAIKRTKLQHEMKLTDVIDMWVRQNGICALSGRNMLLTGDSFGNQASIDRIDNERGYLVSNTQLVCWTANRLKGTYEVGALIELCKDISNFNEQKCVA